MGERRTPARPGAQGEFWLLVAGATVYFVAQGMLFPVLPRYIKRELGGGGFEVGLVVSAFALGAMLARPWGGAFADRVGRRAVATFGAIVWAAMVLLYAPVSAALGAYGLAAARAIGGLGSGVLFVAMATIAIDLAPEARRVRNFGYFSSSTLLGFAAGPPIGVAVLGGGRYGVTFVVVALLALAPVITMVALSDTRPPSDHPVATSRPAMFHPAARRQGLALLLGSLGFITFAAFVPVYADEVGLEHVAIPLTLNAGINLVVRVLAARFVDDFDKRRLAQISVVLSIGAALVLASWSAPAGIYVAAVLNGAGNAYLYPGFLAITIARAAETERSRAIGSLTVFGDLATSVGGAVMGVVADMTDTRGAFVAAAVMGACSLGLVTSWREMP